METFTKLEKKQLGLYALVAYALPWLMGLAMWYGSAHGLDLTAFPNAQMFYPAAGVMLALLVTRRGDALLPKRYFYGFLAFSVLMFATTVLAVTASDTLAAVLCNYVIILGSVVLWVLLLTEKKAKRRAFGLTGRAAAKSVLCVLLFIALYFARLAFSCLLSGELPDLFGVLFTGQNAILALILIPNFFLSFSAFYGEEYGWRYFLQPLLQKRLGMVRGLVALGLLWGLWHLPINLFYYSAPGYGLLSLVNQLVGCVTLGIFFGFTYLATGNLWVPVILHYLNNNMALLLSDTKSADIFTNQTLSWEGIGLNLLINGVFLGAFILAKVCRDRARRLPDCNERADAEAAANAPAQPEAPNA